jgi:hypothetical protein
MTRQTPLFFDSNRQSTRIIFELRLASEHSKNSRKPEARLKRGSGRLTALRSPLLRRRAWLSQRRGRQGG